MPALLSLLTALGWSLLDSVWQLAVLWTVYRMLTLGNLNMSAAGKYNLGLLFIVFGLEWFGYNFFHLLKEPANPVVSGLLTLSPVAGQWIPYLGGLYLLVLVLRFLQFGFHSARRQADRYPISLSPLLQSFTNRYSRILGIAKPVTVYLSEMALTAETKGFFKPLIFLPASLITQLSPAQLEAILIHELYHIRRNDYLFNILISCFRSIFFFNPFALLFSKALERERELACDDGVLEVGYESKVYAEALYSLERFRQVNPGFSLAADGNRPWLLMDRIRRVLGEPARKEKGISRLILTGLTAALVFFGLQFTKIPGGHVNQANTKGLVISRHLEMAEEKIKLPIWEHSDPVSASRRTVKSLNRQLTNSKRVQKRPVFPSRIFSSPNASGAPELVFFTDNNILRNYSNESISGLVTDPVPRFRGAPYIPSTSLSYDVLPENPAADSARQLCLENSLKNAVSANRVQVSIALKKLKQELERSSRELMDIEVKNHRQITLDNRHILPLLKKVHEEMRLKKKELEKLQIDLQLSSEEIIHI